MRLDSMVQCSIELPKACVASDAYRKEFEKLLIIDVIWGIISKCILQLSQNVRIIHAMMHIYSNFYIQSKYIVVHVKMLQVQTTYMKLS